MTEKSRFTLISRTAITVHENLYFGSRLGLIPHNHIGLSIRQIAPLHSLIHLYLREYDPSGEIASQLDQMRSATHSA